MLRSVTHSVPYFYNFTPNLRTAIMSFRRLTPSPDREECDVKGLRYYRRLRGWSQMDLSRRTGLSQNAISDLEIGRTQPRPSTLRRLSEALDVSIEELVEGPKDEALLSGEEDSGERREQIEVPESMRTLLWDRLNTLPLTPLPYEVFEQVFESAEHEEERQQLYELVKRERAEVLTYADEVAARVEAGARISVTDREKLDTWREASRKRELTARELVRAAQVQA
jgi:transcriptional regulator with XRE-family HTH domain